MIETIAVILTIICVWLTTKRHILAWPISLIAVVFYAFVFWDAKLYSDFGLQFFFFAQGIVGWITWKRNLEDTSHTKIEKLSNQNKLYWLSIGIVSYFIVANIMSHYTDAAAPWIDSFVAVFSLIANWLLAKRKIENWWIWITVDFVYVGLFIYKGLYLSAGLYFVLLLIALQGMKSWYLKLNENGLSR